VAGDELGDGRTMVEVSFPPADPEAWRRAIGDGTRYVVIRIEPGALSGGAEVADPPFELKRSIVAAASLGARPRFALDGPEEAVRALWTDDLAPYLDGYVVRGGVQQPGREWPPAPVSDPTARPWWRAAPDDRPLLARLLDGARRHAAVVVVADTTPDADHRAFLDAVRATGAGVLATQPEVDTGSGAWAVFLLHPATSRYQMAAYAAPGRAERMVFRLEPIRAGRVLFPRSGQAVVDSFGATVDVQVDGSSRYWLVELEPGAPPDSARDLLVEDEILVDPYEVVVRNQVFQERERGKVLSLDVMEYATLLARTRTADRTRWEHRILRRRGWLDEYLHLNHWSNGVRTPKDKLHKGILNRPIDHLELAPLEVEHRRTYRYRYLGVDEVGGHPVWKIGFEPSTRGRFASGVVWIDQRTGAHRRITTDLADLGNGSIATEFSTDFEWIADGGQCYWDWRHRTGSQTFDYLDSRVSYGIDYERRDFRYNRTDMTAVVADAHAGDELIHVAVPGEGHRWLLRGADVRPRRGDERYGPVGVLRAGAPRPAAGEPAASTALAAESAVDGAATTTTLGPATAAAGSPFRSAREEVLAGAHAFSTNTRLTMGAFTSSAPGASPQVYYGATYADLDFLGRGRRGKGEIYLFVGGFDSDGLVSLTDPQLGSSRWSLTGSLDIRLDPEQDFLFGRVESDSAGDEGSFRNLSLDIERRSFRVTLARPLTSIGGGLWSTRLRYDFAELIFERTGGTDPAFVLPLDTPEHSVGIELTRSGTRVETALRVDYGYREAWRPWGIDGGEEPERDHVLGSLRLFYARPVASSQAVTAGLTLFGGSGLDRFSRVRLFEVGARVPGYGSGLGADRGVHLSLGHGFRIWKLPLRLRLDYADLHADATASQPVFDQSLLGAQLDLDLHGPWETDWFFAVGRGLRADPSRGPEATYYSLVVSRRFFAD
jgi:hypothetical protein